MEFYATLFSGKLSFIQTLVIKYSACNGEIVIPLAMPVENDTKRFSK